MSHPVVIVGEIEAEIEENIQYYLGESMFEFFVRYKAPVFVNFILEDYVIMIRHCVSKRICRITIKEEKETMIRAWMEDRAKTRIW